MKTKTFHKGGIHPPENKLTSDALPTEILPGALMRVMTAQSIGKEPEVVVKPGDHVAKGDLLAKATAFVSANVHSPADATVKKIEPSRDAQGIWRSSILLESDPEQKPERLTERTEAEVAALSAEQLRDIIADRGIVGLGGATFPTRVKLSVPQGMKAEILIINGAECEPYITSDHRLMLERGEAVIGGARLLAKAVGLKEATIGIELNKPDAIEHLKSIAGGDVHIEALKTRYPQGAEKQLIQMITGRQVPPGKLPADVQCLVCNVATAAAVWDAVTEGKPLTQRGVTLTGGALNEPMNVLVPVGTPIKDLIDAAGGFKADPDRILYGGPMMGNPIYDLDVTMMKSTNCILCLTKAEAAEQDPAQTCIRCGKCVEVCPMKLTPLFMRMNVNKRRWAEVEALRVMDCIECGSCNYICPARLPLVQSFRTAKFAIRDEAAKAKARAEKEKEAAKA